MISNAVKAKLQDGGAVAGSFVNLNSPSVVEVLGLAGVEFIVVDCEHSDITPESAAHLYRAAEAVGVPALTRIGETAQQTIQKYMDAGSLGVQMPLINSGADAGHIVDCVKYPPVGNRGLAGVRANRFGMTEPLADYVERANAETLVVVQIETKEAMARADEIVAVDGVDVVFLGPTDLSVALGVPGQVKHSLVLEAIEEMTRRIVDGGKVSGTIARNADDYTYWRDRGVRYLLTGASQLLGASATQFAKSVREAEATR